MKHHDRTKDELVNELQEVQQKYNSLKELYDTEIIELNQAKQVLKNSEERLSLVFNNTSDMLVLLEVDPDKKLRMAAINRSYLESIKQLISRDDLDANDFVGKYRDEALIALGFSQENLDAELPYFLRAITRATPIQLEQIVPLGTSNIYLESNIVPVTDAAGLCTHLLYSVRDISERKYAEKEIHKSEQRYRNLFENAGIAIWGTDLSAVISYINQLKNSGIRDFRLYFDQHTDEVIKCASMVELDDANKEILNLLKAKSKEQVINSLSDFFIEESFGAVKEVLIGLAEGRLRIEGEIPLKILTGEIKQVLFQLSVVPAENDTGSKGLISFIDITERKQIEESLRFFRMMIDKSQDAIEVIDVETGQFIDVNEKACNDLGYTREELLGMTVFDIDPNQKMHGFQQMIQNIQQSNSMTVESLHHRKDGSYFPVEINIAVVTLEKIYTIAIVRDITEKKLIDKKLKRSEEQLKEAQQVGLFGNWELDVANNRIAMSDEMFKLFDQISNSIDVTMETLLGTPIPEDRKMVRELVTKSLESSEGVDFDFRTMTSNGEIRWIHERSTVEVDDQGNSKRVFGTCQDITERKLFELKLKESEERYRSVAQSANDAIITTDSHGIILDWNQGAEKIFGYAEAEVTGRILDIVLPQSYIAAHNHGMKRIEQGGEHHVVGRTVELNGVHKNGKEFPLELSLAEWETSKGKFFTGIIRDITERKQVEEALLRINTAVEGSGEAICMSDPQGYHFYHNKAFTEIFEYTVQEIQAAGGGTAVYVNRDVGRKVFDMIMGGGTWKGEVEMVSKSGRKFTVLLRTDSIKDRNGVIIGLVGIHTDMTERKLAELKLKESEERLSEISKTDFVWEVDEKGAYTYASQTGIDFFGSTLDDIIGKTPFDFMAPEDRERIASIFSEIVANKAPIKDLENWNIKKNGDLCCLLTNGLPILDKSGNLKGYRGVDRDITKRKRAEDALRESEEDFRSMFENNSAAMAIIEADTTISMVNDEYCKLSGYGKQEIVGTSWTDQIPSEDRERLKEYNRKRMINVKDAPDKYEFTIYKKNGEIGHALMSITMLKNRKIIASFLDITQRKLAEEVLSESERRTKALLNANPDMIFRVNREGVFLDYKADITELYVQNETSIIGKKNRDITPPEFADLMDMYIKQTLDSGELQQFEYQMPTPKRGLRDYEARMIASGIDEVIAVVRDVTERKKAEEKIKESEEKYRLLAESSPEMIYFIDTMGYVTYVNKVAAAQFHAPAQELIGKRLTDIFPPDLAQQNLANIQAVMATKSTFQNEVEIVFPTGCKWVDARLAPVINEKNDVIGVLGLSYDITERKRAEEEIRLKNEQLIKLNAEKDKFFSIIAHDLKSPFGSIMGFSEILIKQVMEKNYQSVERYSGIIYESSQRAVDLLTNLMEWSRSQTGRMEFNPEYFEMVNLINEVALLFSGAASQKSITIVEVFPPNAPVYADKNMMSTVLRNLISNAIKFTYKGGEIVVSIEKKQGELIVSVRDNGVGIPKNRIEKLFRIDENISTLGTEKEKGTGLGMVLCKEFVEKHGGQIWVESEEGKGSVFYFTISSQG